MAARTAEVQARTVHPPGIGPRLSLVRFLDASMWHVRLFYRHLRTMRPLRIVHVTPYSADAWSYGGIPRVVAALSRGLARRGHHVTVCATDVCDRSSRLRGPREFMCDGVHIRLFPNLSNRLAYQFQLFLPVGFGDYLARNATGFDVAHVHACRNLPGVIAARHFRKAGVPYVLAPNGTAPIIERRRVAKRTFDAIAGDRVVAGASKVLAVSNAERRQLR